VAFELSATALFVMQAAEDRLGPDFSTFRQLMSISRPQPLATAPLLIITRFMGRDPGKPLQPRPPAHEPFFQHHSQMTFTEWNQEVQTFSPERSHQTFAKGIGQSRQLHRMGHVHISFHVIHPHHPLRGQKFHLVTYRHNWGEDRVYFHDAEGRLSSIPACWTTVVPEDPFVAMAGGRCFFRYQDLVKLVELVEKLG
jgi:hypothetical protein